jgi:hypothetical protein
MKHIKLFESFDTMISPEEFEAEVDKAIGMGDAAQSIAHLHSVMDANPEILKSPKSANAAKKYLAWRESLPPEDQAIIYQASYERNARKRAEETTPEAPKNDYYPMGVGMPGSSKIERERKAGEKEESARRKAEIDQAVAGLTITPEEYEAHVDKAIAMEDPTQSAEYLHSIHAENPGILHSDSHFSKLYKYGKWAETLPEEEREKIKAVGMARR